MKKLDKTLKVNVEALTSLLRQRKSTVPHFEMPCETSQCYDLLKAAYIAEVERRGRTFVLDDYTDDNLRSVAKALCDNKKNGIMLCGTCGNGKTTMLLAFQNVMNHLYYVGCFEKDEPNGIEIIDAKDIAYQMRGEAQLRMRNEKMLGIEDMGREPAEVLDYGNVHSVMIDLLEYRYANQLFTFITTNLTSKQIREKYGDRIADRFNEFMTVIVFKQKSYRN